MSKTLNEHWPYKPVEPGYLRTRPTPHSWSNSLRKSLPHIPIPGRAVSLCPPYQGTELLRAASSFKRRRESGTLRSAVPSEAFLFVVFVVAGPSDLGPCLTGALQYMFLCCFKAYYRSEFNAFLEHNSGICPCHPKMTEHKPVSTLLTNCQYLTCTQELGLYFRLKTLCPVPFLQAEVLMVSIPAPETATHVFNRSCKCSGTVYRNRRTFPYFSVPCS